MRNKKMYVVLFFVAVIIVLWSVINIPIEGEVKNVLYGEKPHVFEATSTTTRLFFDKKGHIYPTQTISNTALANHQASIKECFKNEPSIFKQIAADYQLASTIYSNGNFAVLQDSILSQQISHINTQFLSTSSNVYVLIHGFRKPLVSQHNTTSSLIDNLIIQSAINAHNSKDNYFIEVYWDGMYDYFEAQKRNQHRETFTLFEGDARTNAVFAGYGIRKIISKLKTSKVTVITHSLGARVALACLFNSYGEYEVESLQSIPTPSQNTVRICLIAPAIGTAPFEEYYNRTTDFKFEEQDNYQLHLLYNEDDIVLLKKWRWVGPGAEKYGDTSLGCNYQQAVQQLKSTFVDSFPKSEILFYNTEIGGTHLVEHYVLSDAFLDFLNH